MDELQKLRSEIAEKAKTLELLEKKENGEQEEADPESQKTALDGLKKKFTFAGVQTNRVVVCGFCGSDKRLDQGVNA